MKCLYVNDFDNPQSITEVNAEFKKDTAILNGNKENVVFLYTLFPLEAKDTLVEICTYRQKLKKEYDDSIALIYKLRNNTHGWEKK